MNERLEARALRQLAAEGEPAARVAAYPTMLQLPFRRVVARTGSEVRVGWANALGDGPIAWERFSPARGPLVDAALASEAGRVLAWFAMGEATPRLAEAGGRAVVEIDDLRYGVPGHPESGLWGVRVFFGPDGRPSRAERFDRPLPVGPGQLLRRIWRGTLGLS
jgi:hypothetical protein